MDEQRLSDSTSWEIIRPSPVHPWSAAIFSHGILIAEISESVATGIADLQARLRMTEEELARVRENY